MGLAYEKRRQRAHGFHQGSITTSTAALADASTALAPNDVIALRSTSTNGPVVYTLSRAPKPGEHLNIHAQLVGATSAGAGFHVNAYSGTFFGSSSEDMATMLGQGNGFSAIATSTIRWGVVGNNAATFGEST
jgi:hypothetical protein